MKYIKLELDKMPRIMYAHECVISKINEKSRKNEYYELTFVESGELFVFGEAFGNQKVGENMFFFAPAEKSYKLELSGEFKHMCVAFFLEGGSICEEEDVVFEKIDNKVKVQLEPLYIPIFGKITKPKILDDWREIINECKLFSSCYSNVKCAQNIMSLLLGIAQKETQNEKLVPSESYYCKKVDDFLFANYAEPYLDMNTIAQYVKLHPNYLSGLYKKCTGKTIKQTLGEIRVTEAKRLLALNKYLIKDVAKMVGFLDCNYFSTVFKRNVGSSPGDYVRMLYEK